MEDPLDIGVLGAGNAGYAISADLTLKGFRVKLYNQSVEGIKPILETGGIEMGGAAGTGFARLNEVTTEMKSAIEDVDIVMVAVPGFGYKPLAELCAPWLRPGQIVVLLADR